MSAAIRLFLSVCLLSGSSTALFAADRSATTIATLPLAPGDAALLGTWAGTIAVDGLTEPFDGGYIAIERTAGDHFRVTVGPEADVRYEGTRLERTEHGLRFEVSLPGFETRLLAYDVTIEHGTMCGSVTFVKHRLTKPGHLDFARQ